MCVTTIPSQSPRVSLLRPTHDSEGLSESLLSTVYWRTLELILSTCVKDSDCLPDFMIP